MFQLRMRWLIGPILLMFSLACSDASEPSDASMPLLLEQGHRYLEDEAYARWALEQSLVTHTNGYARLRLASYTPERWGALPLWNPPSVAATSSEAAADKATVPAAPEEPATLAQWVELGRRLFGGYPTQLASYAKVALRDPELAERFGLWRSAELGWGGVVWTQLPDGSWETALTCASCHAAPQDGVLVWGLNNTRLDLGAWMAQANGDWTSPALGWGPGRVDVTGDGADNPVAIPDLRPLRHQTHLHRTGSVRNDPIALAVRLETLIITSHNQAVRPPRWVALALALYLWDLGAQPSEAVEEVQTAAHQRGRALAEAQCASCHQPPGWSGPPVALSVVGTDPAVGLSTSRGTGG
ncbi:MAG: hypothetical protein AAFS10_08115, partial [Myxococcota bacterium]